jgi:hypothetical protein
VDQGFMGDLGIIDLGSSTWVLGEQAPGALDDQEIKVEVLPWARIKPGWSGGVAGMGRIWMTDHA